MGDSRLSDDIVSIENGSALFLYYTVSEDIPVRIGEEVRNRWTCSWQDNVFSRENFWSGKY